MEKEKVNELGLAIGDVLDQIVDIVNDFDVEGVTMLWANKDGWGSAEVKGEKLEVKRRQGGEILIVEESVIRKAEEE